MTRGLIILNEIAKLGWIAGRDLNNETSRFAEATSSALLIFYIFFLFLYSLLIVIASPRLKWILKLRRQMGNTMTFSSSALVIYFKFLVKKINYILFIFFNITFLQVRNI